MTDPDVRRTTWLAPVVVSIAVLSSLAGVALAATPADARCADPACADWPSDVARAKLGQSNLGQPTAGQANGTAGAIATGPNATGPNATAATGSNATGDSNDTLVLDGTTLPDYAPSVFRDVDGEVATRDGTVAVVGTAPGLDEVLVVVIDSRGRIASRILPVDGNDVFREDDFPLVTPGGEELAEGQLVAAVFGVGRDGYVGDGRIAGFEEADLEALDESTRERAREEVGNDSTDRTPLQVLELFYDESVDDAGSDDVALVDGFRYTEGRTVVESVGPATEPNATGVRPVAVGETVLVRGQTNRKPDDAVIAVAAVDGPAPRAFPIATTDDWGTDGVWSVELDTRGVEPGTYTLESDDGEVTDRVEVRVVPEGDDGASGNTTGGSNASTALEPPS